MKRSEIWRRKHIASLYSRADMRRLLRARRKVVVFDVQGARK